MLGDILNIPNDVIERLMAESCTEALEASDEDLPCADVLIGLFMNKAADYLRGIE